MSDLAFEPTLRAFLPGIGAVLDGRYRIEAVIGKGGMGIVYAAHHVLLGERVALKLLLEEAARSPDAIARFLNEARSAAKIKNEHVARVMDVGTLEKSGVAFIALEYLEGMDLAQLLVARGRLSIAEAADYVLQALEAVAAAHALGIVHRDLKPANLFLAQREGDEIIKVLDFGISKVQEGMHAQVAALTSAGAILGSPFYIPPEQLRSARNVDARADVWAIGIILYEMLTGVVPFTGESVGEVFSAILEQTPVPPTTRRADLPPQMERIILKCLARSPDHRYQTVGELALDLAPFAPPGHVSATKIQRTLQKGARQSWASLPNFVPGPAASATSSAWGTNKDQAVVPRRAHSWVGLALAVAVPMLVVLVAVAAIVFLRTGTRSVTVGASSAPIATPPPFVPPAPLEPAVTASAPATSEPATALPPPSATATPAASVATDAPSNRKPGVTTASSAKPQATPSASPAGSSNPIFYPQ